MTPDGFPTLPVTTCDDPTAEDLELWTRLASSPEWSVTQLHAMVLLVIDAQRQIAELRAWAADRGRADSQVLRHFSDEAKTGIRRILSAHLSELAANLDGWPKESPTRLLACLEVGECSALEHIDRVYQRLVDDCEP